MLRRVLILARARSASVSDGSLPAGQRELEYAWIERAVHDPHDSSEDLLSLHAGMPAKRNRPPS